MAPQSQLCSFVSLFCCSIAVLCPRPPEDSGGYQDFGALLMRDKTKRRRAVVIVDRLLQSAARGVFLRKVTSHKTKKQSFELFCIFH